KIKEGDVLVVDAPAEAIDAFVGALKLEFPGRDELVEENGTSDMALAEVVVPRDSRLDGRSIAAVGLSRRHSVSLIGVSRQGKVSRQQVRRLPIAAGDVLLLVGPPDRLADAVQWLGALPLAER